MNEMATKVNYSYRNHNGQGIWLPPNPAAGLANLAIPNIFEETATQVYPLGTRLVDGERVFHYYKAGAEILRTLSSLVSYQAMLTTAKNTHDAVLAGVSKILIDGTGDGDPAADYYKDSYMLIIGATYYNRVTIRVISSLAAETDGTPWPVELTLAQALPFDVADDTSVEIMPNRYADCRTCFGGSGIDGTAWTQVGVPARKMTSGYYGWVQTWGPAPISGTDPDTGVCLPGNRMAVFASDGCVTRCADWWGNAGPKSYQMAGYSIGPNSTGNLWVYLMIDP